MVIGEDNGDSFLKIEKTMAVAEVYAPSGRKLRRIVENRMR